MRNAYSVQYSESAAKQLKHIDKSVAKRILDKTSKMASTAKIYQHKRLQGPLGEYYSLRVSKYRIIYRLDHEAQLVKVERIGLRDDIYDV